VFWRYPFSEPRRDSEIGLGYPDLVSTRAKWREHVRAWRASGQSAAEYCRRAGLNPHTLSWWAWKLGRDDKSAPPDRAVKPPTFVELAAIELPSSSRFELEVASVVVRVPFDFQDDALRRLLDTLEARQ
jgi:hypothetical protein